MILLFLFLPPFSRSIIDKQLFFNTFRLGRERVVSPAS